MSAPHQIGPYRVVRQLGQGGMGTVFEVHDPEAKRNLALKLLPRARAKGKAAERFLREARALAKVNHPNVVSIHDVGEDPAGLYYVMDLVPGQEVGELALSGVVPERDAAELTLGVAEAVAAIHAAGLLHRDVKPDNVVLRADRGTPILLDFGLALDGDSERLTKTGQIVGTPYAMSPEQASGVRELTPATDVYGVGVILYMLLARRPPFEADQMIGLLAKVCQEEPTWPKTSPGLGAILRCAMAKDPTRRYPSAAELCRDLERYLAGERVAAAPPRSRRPLALAAGALAILVVGGLFAALRPSPSAPTPSPSPSQSAVAKATRTPRRNPLRELARARSAEGQEGRRLIARWLLDYPERPEAKALRQAYLTRGFKEPVGSWRLPDSLGHLGSRGERLLIGGSETLWEWLPGLTPEPILKGDLSVGIAAPAGWLVIGARRTSLVRGKTHAVSLALLDPKGGGRWAATRNSRVTSLALHGDVLWVGHRDGTVVGVSWSEAQRSASPTKVAVLPEFRSPVSSLVVDPKHQLLFATSGEMVGHNRDAPDRRLIAWSIDTLPPTKRFEVKLPGSGGKILLHPSRDLLALSVLWVQELRVYDYQGKMLRSLEGIQAQTGTTSILAGASGATAHSQQIRGLVFLPSGILLSSAGKTDRGELRAWDVESGEELATKTEMEGFIFDLHVTPRGEVFSTRYLGQRPGLIEQWDLVPGAPVAASSQKGR